MPLWNHSLDKKKTSGGKKRRYRSNRAFDAGGFTSETSLKSSRRMIKKGRGGTRKMKLFSEQYANVTDSVEKLTKKVEILKVISSPVNAEYNRRKIMTKGALIETSLGEATITSRPGQNGVINAVLSSKRG